MSKPSGMDRKSIILIAISFLLIMGWFPLVNKIWPPKIVPIDTNAVARAAQNLPIVTNAAPNASFIPARTNAPVIPIADANSPEKFETLETEFAKYVVTSHGGGLKRVELKQYPQSVDKARKSPGAYREWAKLNGTAPTPVLTWLADEKYQGDGIYALRKEGQTIVAEKALTNGLRLVKTFQPLTNYLMSVTARIENSSGQPIILPPQEWILGSATPMGAFDTDPMMLGVYYYNGEKVTHTDASSFSSGGGFSCSFKAPTVRTESAVGPIQWAAVHNQFFTMALVLNDAAQKAVIHRVDLPAPTAEDLKEHPNATLTPYGLEASLVYPGTVLGIDSTNRAIERRFTLYAGPKEYYSLAYLEAGWTNRIDEVMGFNDIFGGRFAGFFAKGLLLSMNWLHNNIKLSYALSIIAITVIIKLIFWPLTTASTRSMKRMSILQPQMKALQEKYKDDPTKMNQKLMEFMKENKVNPLGGCLPMLIQIPVFIGFYAMIRTAIELRGATFLWATDLSRPDTIALIAGVPVNPIPIIMGVTMWYQAHLTPPSPGMDPMQQRIMKYMPLMFMVFLYNMSAGLTLYWTVQNLLTIAQMKLTKAYGPADQKPVALPVKNTKGR